MSFSGASRSPLILLACVMQHYSSTQAQTPQNPPIASIVGSNCLVRIPASTPGRTYFVQWSPDLVNWKYMDRDRHGQ